MPYQALADLIILVHIAFIVFVLFGGLLAFRWRWMPLAHLPAVVWGAAVEFFGWVCPLGRYEMGTGKNVPDCVERCVAR